MAVNINRNRNRNNGNKSKLNLGNRNDIARRNKANVFQKGNNSSEEQQENSISSENQSNDNLNSTVSSNSSIDDKIDEESSDETNAKIRIPKSVKIKIAIGIIAIAVIALIIIFFITIIMAIFGGMDVTDPLSKDDSGDNLICDTIEVTCGPTSKNCTAGTYSMDDYVAGVIANEVGSICSHYDEATGYCDQDKRYEALKAFAIMARSYVTAIVSESGVCSIESSTNFQVMRPTNSELFKKAATETAGIYVVDDDGKVVKTSYDCIACAEKYIDDDGETWYVINQPVIEHSKVPKSWLEVGYKSVITNHSEDWLLCDGFKHQHHGRGASQVGMFYLADQEDYSYKEILLYYYSPYVDGTTDEEIAAASLFKSNNESGSSNSSDTNNTDSTTTDDNENREEIAED